MKNFVVSVFIIFAMLFAVNVAKAADGIKWKNPQKITIYIPEHKRSLMMKHSLEEWTRKTNKKILFYYVDSVKKADIEVRFVEKIDKSLGADKAIGLTQSQYYGRYFFKSTISIANKTPNNLVLGNDAVYTVMLHEVGHAIGLLNHSEDRLSIMHAMEDDKQEISNEDLSRLQRLYGW